MSSAYRRVPAFDALKAIHAALTFVMAGLGGVLFAPGDTFSSSTAWRLFVELGIKEDQLGLLLLAIAVIGVLGIAPSRAWMRRWSILVLATAHATLAITFFVGNPVGGAVVPYTAYAALALYTVSREAGGDR